MSSHSDHHPELELFGWHNEVVCADSPTVDYKLNDTFAMHKLGPHSGLWAYSSRLLPWLRLNAVNFDAIFVHGLWSYHSYAASHFVSKLKKAHANAIPKVFVMPHGMLDPWFQRDSSRRFKAWRNWLYWKLVEKHVIANADGLLFTCQKEMELAREPFRLYQPKAESVVGLGVAEPPTETEAMHAAFHASCPDLQGRPFLLFISRIHPKKGADLLIKSYAKLVAENDGRKSLPALVIAGPKETEYANQMQQLAHELKLMGSSEQSVFFPGMLQGDAKWGAFYGCEAFVLPSHQENFGIAVVEALACCKPVLISDQVNIYQEIANYSAGLVCSDTADGVNKLVQDWIACPDSKRLEMKCDARKCFDDLFKASNAARRLVEVIGG